MATPIKRVLLTGSRGFTGRYLRRSLEAQGHEVVGVVNDGAPGAGEVACDISDAHALRDLVGQVEPEYVLHLAAISFVPHADVHGIYATNAMGTLHLLDALACLARAPRRVILASSANVYGNTACDLIDESRLPAPLNHYAASKLAMEAIASVFRSRLPVTVTRPFNYTGPGQDDNFLIPKVVRHYAERSAFIELGNIDIERDFLDVRSVASIYTMLLEADPGTNDVVNVCSGTGTTLQEVLAALERITGHRMQVRVNPDFVRSSDIRRLVGSNARLRSLVGAWPEYTLEQTLRDMLDASADVRVPR